MTELASSSSEQIETATKGDAPVSRRRLVSRIVIVLVVLMLGFGLYAMFVPSPRVPKGVLTATEDDEADSGYQQEGEVSEGSLVAATATKLKSNKQVGATTAEVSSRGDRLFDRTIAIYNHDDDLLMKRVGLALFERLRDTGRFRQVRYLPAGETLPDGELLPDIFMTLDKISWDEGGIPGNRRFEGELVVTASDRFRRSSHSYSSPLTPPQARFRWRAEVGYSATQTGIETSGARYQAVSRDLAKEISGHLTKLLDGLAEKHGTAGELPEQFYPDYAEPPEFGFLEDLEARTLVQGPTFMQRCVAFWKVEADLTPREVIAAVSRSLTEGGWNVPEAERDGTYLRAAHGNEVVEVFRGNDGLMNEHDPQAVSTTMYVRYSAGMSPAEVNAVLEKQFKEHPSETLLLMFQTSWHEHQKLVEDYFRKHAPTDAEAWLRLASLRQKSDPEAAREALLRANALQRIVHHKAADSSMKKLAEELGIGKLPSRISPEMIESLGVRKMLETGEIELEVRENEMAVLWIKDSDEEQKFLLLTPIRRKDIVPERTLLFELITLSGESGWSRSRMTTGDLTDTDGPMVSQSLGVPDSLTIFSEPLQDGQSYRLTLQLDAPE